MEHRFTEIQRQQDATTAQAKEALLLISKAFGRLLEVQTAHDASIKTTSESTDRAASTITQLQMEKSIDDSEIQRLNIRQSMQESDSDLAKRETVEQFSKVSNAIEVQEETTQGLKSDGQRDENNCGRDDRGLGVKVNIGKVPMGNVPMNFSTTMPAEAS